MKKSNRTIMMTLKRKVLGWDLLLKLQWMMTLLLTMRMNQITQRHSINNNKINNPAIEVFIVKNKMIQKIMTMMNRVNSNNLRYKMSNFTNFKLKYWKIRMNHKKLHQTEKHSNNNNLSKIPVEWRWMILIIIVSQPIKSKIDIQWEATHMKKMLWHCRENRRLTKEYLESMMLPPKKKCL